MVSFSNVNTRSGRRNALQEWSPLVVGLLAGFIMSAVLLRGGTSAETATAHKPVPVTPIPVTIAPVTVETPLPSVKTPDPEVSPRKKRAADLEQQQIARQLAELEEETTATPQAVHKMPTRPHAPQEETSGKPSPSSVQAVIGRRTFAYWNGMNDIIARESVLRTAPRKVNADNAGSFVDSRTEAGQFAASKLSELSTTSVDTDAVAVGQELIAWYREEATLGEQAKSLLGSTDIAARKGAAGNAWRAAEEKHRRLCDDINRRAADVQSRLSRKYGMAFPKLN